MAVAPAERVSSAVRRVRRLLIHDASCVGFGLSLEGGYANLSLDRCRAMIDQESKGNAQRCLESVQVPHLAG
jgi:hypothetical protein